MQERQEKIKLLYKRQLSSRNQVHSMDTSRPDNKHFYEHPYTNISRGDQSLTRRGQRKQGLSKYVTIIMRSITLSLPENLILNLMYLFILCITYVLHAATSPVSLSFLLHHHTAMSHNQINKHKLKY